MSKNEQNKLGLHINIWLYYLLEQDFQASLLTYTNILTTQHFRQHYIYSLTLSQSVSP